METSNSTLIMMMLLLIVTAIYVFGEEELHKKIKGWFSRRNWKKKHNSLKFRNKK